MSTPQSYSTSTSAPTTTATPHPRAALRNKNLPKLPDFEFPLREPSPLPEEQVYRQQELERRPQRDAPAPPSKEGARSAIREKEVKREGKLRNFEAEDHSNQAKGARGSQRRTSAGKVVDRTEGEDREAMAISDLSRKGQWIFYAITSGGCAAVNGVFAKLTTTEVTTNFATFLANLIGLEKGEKAFEVLIRAIFFLLNLLFNAIMWALFTKALSRGPSTTQVSILNTSSNFMLTALMGFIIFSEALPPMWWLGAALLVAGNVIIGRREEKELGAPGEHEAGAGPARAAEGGDGGYRDEREEGRSLLADDIELSETESEELRRKRVAREVEEDILDLEPANGAESSKL